MIKYQNFTNENKEVTFDLIEIDKWGYFMYIYEFNVINLML